MLDCSISLLSNFITIMYCTCIQNTYLPYYFFKNSCFTRAIFSSAVNRYFNSYIRSPFYSVQVGPPRLFPSRARVSTAPILSPFDGASPSACARPMEPNDPWRSLIASHSAFPLLSVSPNPVPVPAQSSPQM